MTKRFQTIFDYDYKEQPGERNTLPSLTVPNQSLTVLEMVARHQGGLDVDGTNLKFSGGEILPNLAHLDLVDRQAMVDAMADKLVEIKERLQAKAKSEKDKAFLQAVEEETKKRLEELRKPAAAGGAAGQGTE